MIQSHSTAKVLQIMRNHWLIRYLNMNYNKEHDLELIHMRIRHVPGNM